MGRQQGGYVPFLCRVGGGDLVLYDKLGTLDWWDIGRLTSDMVGYPQGCYGTPGFTFPAFYPTAVYYAPPGCTKGSSSSSYSCSPASSVQYTLAGSVGVTTSTQNSFSAGATVTATANLTAPLFLDVTQVSGSFGYTVTNTKGSSTTLSNTASNTFGWSPQSPDGIWHDSDYISGIVSPAIMLKSWLDPITQQNNVEWELGIPASEGNAYTYDYTVFQLRCTLAGFYELPRTFPGGPPPSNLAPIYDPHGTCAQNPNSWLPSNAPKGLTISDYEQILSLDPFWNADPTLPLPPPPSDRYTRQQTYGFPYLHPQVSAPGQPFACASQIWQKGVMHGDTTTSSTKKDITLSSSTTIKFPKIFSLKETDKFVWSDTTTTLTTDNQTDTAQVSVMCSSSNWKGPGFITVWYDNLFGTYLFDLSDFPCPGCKTLLNGNVTLANGVVVPGMPVDLVGETKTYHTATDNNGHFVFFTEDTNPIESLTATLSVGGVSKPVTLGSQAEINVVVPQPTPVIAVYREDLPGIPAGSGDHRRDAIAMRFTNLSGVTTATNVTVTAIAPTHAAIVYEPGELTLPFVIPGGAALKPGETSSFNLDFTDTSGTAPAPFSFVIKVKADNVPEFSTTIKVP